jgi:hypothetical protein
VLPFFRNFLKLNKKFRMVGSSAKFRILQGDSMELGRNSEKLVREPKAKNRKWGAGKKKAGSKDCRKKSKNKKIHQK